MSRPPWYPVEYDDDRYGPSGGPFALQLLMGAQFFVDAELSTRSGGYLKNLGLGGSALDARFGSTTGSDTNDPKDLTWSGTNYLYLPGVTGNSASSPDAAALDITGDIEIILRMAQDDWTLATGGRAISKTDGASTATGGGYEVYAGGPDTRINLQISNGTISSNVQSTSVTGLLNGTMWIRVTWVASTSTASFFFAADQTEVPSSWTAAGTAVTTGITSIGASTQLLRIGDRSDGLRPLAGKFYRAIVRNGIGGTTVFDADFTRGITSGGQTSFTESSSNAATVTINRSTSGRKAVAVVRPTILLGTDDYLEVAHSSLIDMAAGDSFSVVGVVRLFNAPASNGRIVQKGTATDPRWFLFNTTTGQAGTQVTDTVNTTTPATTATATLGNVTVFAAVVNRTSQLATPYLNNSAGTPTSTATIGSLSNVATLRIGTVPGSVSNPFEGEILAAAVKRGVWTAADIAAIVAYYGAS